MSLHLSASKHANVLDGCRFCGMCTHACTVANATHNDPNAPRGKGRLLYALHTGMIDFSPRVIELLYQCTNCKLCQAWCVPKLDPGDTIRDARRDLVERSLAPDAAIAVSRAIADTQNPYGEPISSRVQLDGSTARAKGKLLYFIDSHTAYREHAVARTTWQLLQSLGAQPIMLHEFLDSGETLLELGFVEQARTQAQKLLAALRASHAQTIVFSSADAYHMVAKEYPDTLGLSTEGLRLLHISEFLAEQIKMGRFKLKQHEARVTWHDPCRLGRGMNIYEAPRFVLSQVPGLDLVEPHWTREHAVCCGAGGGLSFTNPKVATEAAKQAGHVLSLTKTDLIVTGCARCKTALTPGLQGVPVLEFSELIQQVL